MDNQWLQLVSVGSGISKKVALLLFFSFVLIQSVTLIHELHLVNFNMANELQASLTLLPTLTAIVLIHFAFYYATTAYMRKGEANI